MKSIKITPHGFTGTVNVPPSKSMSHRAVIAACLANGCSVVDNIVLSKDIIATCEGMKALGAKIEVEKVPPYGHRLKIEGFQNALSHPAEIPCNESGSTLRFLIPIAALQTQWVTFQGNGKLVERPLAVYYDLFSENNIAFETQNGQLPMRLKGPLQSGHYTVKGDVSSQFVSGLLFALPLCTGDSAIDIAGPLESKGYVHMTLEVLKAFGIVIHNIEDKKYIIPGNQKYQPTQYTVESDYSQAAFWIAAGILGGEVTLKGLKSDSKQGDKAIVDLVRLMGGQIHVSESGELTAKKSATHGIHIDATDIPDIVPILSVVAALSEGSTTITGAARLKIKESDRLLSTATELNKLGAKVELQPDGLVIHGVKGLNFAALDSWNDHRIAMSMAVASCVCSGEIAINGAESVEKSYPHFWEDFKKIGGVIHECNVG